MPGIIHVVDDDSSYLTTIQQLLEATGYRVATYASAQQLLDQPPAKSAKGCILLDVRLPGLTGPELQGRLAELGSTLPVIFVTGYPDIAITVKTIKAGADNFLIKPVRSDELLTAIQRALARHRSARAQNDELEAFRTRLSSLTPRQRQVFEMVVRGTPNRHAARELHCTERTIKAHRRVIMEKMKVRTVPQLVTIAERLGVVARSTER